MTLDDVGLYIHATAPLWDHRLSISPEVYANHLHFWPKLVTHIRPKHFVELGTGQGRTGGLVMLALPMSSYYTTVNLNDLDNQRFGQELDGFTDDPRMLFLRGDSRSQKIVEEIVKGISKRGTIDLLFIDSDHFASVARQEWYIYQYLLSNEALVVVDDLDQNDMMDFWNDIKYEKTGYPMGMFIYRRG